jgi:hypothetical protein
MKFAGWIGIAMFAATAPLATGCASQTKTTATPQSEPPVTYAGTPTLVAIDGGVWVVRDSTRAAYYVDGSYWVFKDGAWYKSESYEGPWASVEAGAVPSVVVSRDHTHYVRFHGEANARTRPGPQRPEPEPPATAEAATPPGHDENPGVGNQRKAEGEQPGHAPHADAQHAKAAKPKHKGKAVKHAPKHHAAKK